ncbi:MAG: hypothetical protein WC307_06590 [Candidatus Nanoarchaeia archaeon]|jgi:hypothetical protein
MKIRLGFVSNSSSSSFVISKNSLTNYQLNAIREHSAIGRIVGIPYSDEEWDIHEDEDNISGNTMMDNFDMREFFDLINISNHFVGWGHS